MAEKKGKSVRRARISRGISRWVSRMRDFQGNYPVNSPRGEYADFPGNPRGFSRAAGPPGRFPGSWMSRIPGVARWN